jgi:hypothetical protein
MDEHINNVLVMLEGQLASVSVMRSDQLSPSDFTDRYELTIILQRALRDLKRIKETRNGSES